MLVLKLREAHLTSAKKAFSIRSSFVSLGTTAEASSDFWAWAKLLLA